MARIYSPLGKITGSIGNLTFSGRPGVGNVIGSKIAANGSNTAAQQDTRARFKLLSTLGQALSALLRAGMPYVAGRSWYNQFVAANFEGTSYDPLNDKASMNFTQLQLSSGPVGPLAGFKAVKATAAADTVTVSWASNADGGQALATDKLNVALVNKQTNAVLVNLGTKTRATSPLAIQDARLAGVATADVVAVAYPVRADDSQAGPTAQVTATVN